MTGKSAPALHPRQRHPRCLQHLAQGLAAAGGIGGNQHPARIACQEAAQGIGRGVVFLRQRQGWGWLHGQRVGLGIARMLRVANVDPVALVQAFTQGTRCQPKLAGGQQGALDIVAQLIVAVLDVLPRLLAGLQGALTQHRHGAGQIIEQARGTAVVVAVIGKKQRQVILDTRRCQTGFQILHQCAAAGVDVEAFAQRVQCTLHMGIVHRHFAAGQ